MLGHRAIGDSHQRSQYQVAMAATATASALGTATFTPMTLLIAPAYARATASVVLNDTPAHHARLPAVFFFVVPSDR